MTVSVQSKLVAGSGNLGGQRRISLHLLANHKECRGGATTRERLQHRWRSLGVRAVVERQRDASIFV